MTRERDAAVTSAANAHGRLVGGGRAEIHRTYPVANRPRPGVG